MIRTAEELEVQVGGEAGQGEAAAGEQDVVRLRTHINVEGRADQDDAQEGNAQAGHAGRTKPSGLPQGRHVPGRSSGKGDLTRGDGRLQPSTVRAGTRG